MLLWSLTREDTQYGYPKRSLKGHSHFVQDVVISSDGQFALTGSWDHTLRLWDLHTGQTTRRFIGHTKDVLSVAFSMDNRQVHLCSVSPPLDTLRQHVLVSDAEHYKGQCMAFSTPVLFCAACARYRASVGGTCQCLRWLLGDVEGACGLEGAQVTPGKTTLCQSTCLSGKCSYMRAAVHLVGVSLSDLAPECRLCLGLGTGQSSCGTPLASASTPLESLTATQSGSPACASRR